MEIDTEAKRRHEQDTMKKILRLYCHGKNHERADGEDLCPDCQRLLDYAHARIEACPRMEVKTFCAMCPIHCYGKAERQQVKTVMRYAGPRMLFHHPWMTLRHMYLQWRQKEKMEKGA